MRDRRNQDSVSEAALHIHGHRVRQEEMGIRVQKGDDSVKLLTNGQLNQHQVFCHIHEEDESRARDICIGLLENNDLHLFFQVKCHLMLAILAETPPHAEHHFKEAALLCTRLYENRNDGEEEEISAYQQIISDGASLVKAEMKEWRLEQGLQTTHLDLQDGDY